MILLYNILVKKHLLFIFLYICDNKEKMKNFNNIITAIIIAIVYTIGTGGIMYI